MEPSSTTRWFASSPRTVPSTLALEKRAPSSCREFGEQLSFGISGSKNRNPEKPLSSPNVSAGAPEVTVGRDSSVLIHPGWRCFPMISSGHLLVEASEDERSSRAYGYGS